MSRDGLSYAQIARSTDMLYWQCYPPAMPTATGTMGEEEDAGAAVVGTGVMGTDAGLWRGRSGAAAAGGRAGGGEGTGSPGGRGGGKLAGMVAESSSVEATPLQQYVTDTPHTCR